MYARTVATVKHNTTVVHLPSGFIMSLIVLWRRRVGICCSYSAWGGSNSSWKDKSKDSLAEMFDCWDTEVSALYSCNGGTQNSIICWSSNIFRCFLSRISCESQRRSSVIGWLTILYCWACYRKRRLCSAPALTRDSLPSEEASEWALLWLFIWKLTIEFNVSIEERKVR